MPTGLLPAPPTLRAEAIALFLDVDGTLVEIEREPGAVHVPEPLCEVLRRLQRCTDGALALVSGRSLAQLDRLFAPLQLSAAGLHGLEHRNLPGEPVRVEPDAHIFERPLARLQRFAADTPGILVEDKGLTLALHYRNAPDQQAAATDLVRSVIAESNGALALLEGKMVFELKPPGVDKGHAIAAFMDEPPFRGRTPVFAGDDVTDEAGFAVIRRLDGIAIRIGENNRPTAATYGHASVAAMQRWLETLLNVEAA